MGGGLEGAQGEAGVGSGSGCSKRVSWALGAGEPLQVLSHAREPRPQAAPCLGPSVSVCNQRAGGAISPAIWTACLGAFGAHPPVCSPRSNCPEISITVMQMTGAGGRAEHTCQGSHGFQMTASRGQRELGSLVCHTPLPTAGRGHCTVFLPQTSM